MTRSSQGIEPPSGSSKAALNLLTNARATEFGPRDVRVNTVDSGLTCTQAPQDAAEAIVFLADDTASAVPSRQGPECRRAR
ncbi:hypothetical protein ABZ468_53960 [Streptomyces sp. NPDC005708]|uniref:hypothetical protein n=1 Tax=Streptomyces sp. NPDC005708 TaxID=3154564 RepID=UPI0033F3F62A